MKHRLSSYRSILMLLSLAAQRVVAFPLPSAVTRWGVPFCFAQRSAVASLSQQRLSSKTPVTSFDDGDRPYAITTPIYYVNDKPHIGHAYTSIGEKASTYTSNIHEPAPSKQLEARFEARFEATLQTAFP
jgi:hypothetical protein